MPERREFLGRQGTSLPSAPWSILCIGIRKRTSVSRSGNAPYPLSLPNPFIRRTGVAKHSPAFRLINHNIRSATRTPDRLPWIRPLRSLLCHLPSFFFRLSPAKKLRARPASGPDVPLLPFTVEPNRHSAGPCAERLLLGFADRFHGFRFLQGSSVSGSKSPIICTWIESVRSLGCPHSKELLGVICQHRKLSLLCEHFGL